MNLTLKTYFYLPLSIIFITIFRNSWLPGSQFIAGKENYIIFIISIVFFILYLDFGVILKGSIKFIADYNKYLLLLIILLLISTIIYNIQELTKFSYLIRFLDLLFYFLIFFKIFPKLLLNTPELFKKLVLIISFTGIVTSVFGFMLLFIGYNPKITYQGFLISFIYHPNYVPFIVNFGIISSIYYLDWQKNRLTFTYKLFLLVSILIQILAVLFTYSRQAYIALGLGLMVYFFLKYKLKFFLLLPFAFFSGIFLIPYLKFKGFASFVSRFYLLIPAYQMMIKDKIALFWGYGLTNTFTAFLDYNSLYGSGEVMNNPHNSFISLILMFGIFFAVLVLTLVLLQIIKYFIIVFKTLDENEKKISIYFISMMIVFLVLNLFESVLVQIEYFNMQLFFVFWGLMQQMSKSPQKVYMFR